MQSLLSGLLAHCFKVLSYGALFLPLQKRALQACDYSSVNAEFAMRKKREVLKNDFVFCGFCIWKYDKTDLKCYVVTIS